MKFAIVFGVIALATLAYCQPVVDTVNHHPSPPVKKPVKPIASKPNKEQAKPNALKPVKEPTKPAALKPVKEPAVLQPDENTQKVDYFNGKVVPTPKYPTN